MAKVPVKIGKYAITGKIAEGGMGAVFKGIHPTVQQAVVLKKLTLKDNDQLVERFRREAKIMIDCSHENIVRVYDHFKSTSSYYIVQEYVDGASVDILLKKERYLSVDLSLHIFYNACKALEYAHNRQVIHRDIKPANIMVSQAGDIKLVDFGIAQSESEEDTLTKDGMALGTPSYMAPEQFEDSRNVSFQADIYSLGVMLYEMLTGKKPYSGKINPETLSKIQKGKYLDPRKHNPDIPPWLSRYIKKCMHPRTKKRAKSVTALIARLERWHQKANIDEIKSQLSAIIKGEPYEASDSGLIKRQKIKNIILVSLTSFLILAGVTFFCLNQGYHYRYLLNKRYGGVSFTIQLKDISKDASEFYIKSSLYYDDNDEIPLVAGQSVKYSILTQELGQATLSSKPVYLSPGAYRVKTIIDDQITWKNFYLKPLNSSDKIQFNPDIQNEEILRSQINPQPITLVSEVSDRMTGESLSSVATVYVMQGREKLAVADLEEPLLSGAVYYFSVDAPGYYSSDYNLKVERNQTLLNLDLLLTPIAGEILIKGLPQKAKLKIDESTRSLEGGFPGSYRMLSDWQLEESGRMKLAPGEYHFSIEHGKKLIEWSVNIESEESLTYIFDPESNELSLKE